MKITDNGDGEVTIDFTAKSSNRGCGTCTLCCRLLPTRFDDGTTKPANQRCRHQCRKGCAIYGAHPLDCQAFECRWLAAVGTEHLRRPDRSHYVIDPMPDQLRLQGADDDEVTLMPAVQIWVDPEHPDAHRDPALRAYLQDVGVKHGMAAIIRYSSIDGFALFPPALTGEGWIERRDSVVQASTDFGDYAQRQRAQAAFADDVAAGLIRVERAR